MIVVPGTARAVATQALTIALAYAAAKVHEEGGNNRGDQVEFFQRLMGGAPGDPWCADFVCTCLVKGYARHTGQGEDRALLPGYVHAASAALIPLSGYCPTLSAGARARGILKPARFAASPGDLVLFDFEGAGEPHHVGIVRVAGLANVQTVEGNTSSGAGGSQADGDGVFQRIRPRGHVFGFIHW